ncbi:hypothetical protein BGX29_010014 [Mortierella sp. GBA35]|nr:hypothetical protein BGX23_012364 [Mortierella sp. AD031]KAF9106258.1 hypothetical protein BGX29_010014 [Mortierella sp. GBA35]KAG0217463.1 hypothetical protein BGX33_010474 [Mortierella sp. NVP41]
MAGPKLEVFKACSDNIITGNYITQQHGIGLYIFTPVMFMVYFGAPEFYDKHVRNSKFWPAPEVVNTRTGIDKQELLYEVERLKQERLARKSAREGLSNDKSV